MQCQRLSPVKAYARLLAMRRQPCNFPEGAIRMGRPMATPSERPMERPIEGRPWQAAEGPTGQGDGYIDLGQGPAAPAVAGDGYVAFNVTQTGPQPGKPQGDIPVTMTISGQESAQRPSASPQSPDEGRVKTAVQNFRNILTDIERQQSQQRSKLERLAYKARRSQEPQREAPREQARPNQEPQREVPGEPPNGTGSTTNE